MRLRRIIATFAALAALAVIAVPASTAFGQTVHKCDGKVATIVGTNGPDILMGTDGKDVIVGLGGDDRIIGGRGNDTICGGKGRDRISGGAGKDTVFGGSGNDRVAGGSAADTVSGGPGNDRVGGNGGDDTVIGDSGRDRVEGDDGVDECIIDTEDGRRGECETGNWRTLSGVGDQVANPALNNSFVVLRHCFPFIARCDPYYVAQITIDGATDFDALGVQAFNGDGELIVDYGDVGDVFEGEFLFSERPAAIEVDSGGGAWDITFVQRSGVPVFGRTKSGSGNAVYLVDDPVPGLGTATATWDGYGNFAVFALSASEGRELLVNEVRFADTSVPPFSVETVPRPGVELIQVISDAGGWTVALAD